jgi:hypothetical protein
MQSAVCKETVEDETLEKNEREKRYFVTKTGEKVKLQRILKTIAVLCMDY